MAFLDLQGLRGSGTRWAGDKPSTLSILGCEFKSSLSLLLCPK
jgi:hypothetical protein